jgi:hypothetical protein
MMLGVGVSVKRNTCVHMAGSCCARVLGGEKKAAHKLKCRKIFAGCNEEVLS